MRVSEVGESRPNWKTVIGEVVRRSKKRLGKAENLTRELERQGLLGRGERYSDSAVSSWLNEGDSPSAEVLLALAWAAHVSLDELIFPEDPWREEIQRRVAALEAGAVGSTTVPALQRGGISGQAGLRDSAGG